MIRLIAFVFVAFSFFETYSQKQLIFLKGERVVARYQVGDYFKCKLKNGTYSEGRIIELREFSIITTTDSIGFMQMEKVRLKHRPGRATSGLGGFMLVGGPLYFLIDQFNVLFVDGHNGVDAQVAKVSLTMAAIGAALVFIKPNYYKVWKFKVRTIDYTSPFYKFRQ